MIQKILLPAESKVLLLLLNNFLIVLLTWQIQGRQLVWWEVVDESFSSIEYERTALQQVALVLANAATNSKYRLLSGGTVKETYYF